MHQRARLWAAGFAALLTFTFAFGVSQATAQVEAAAPDGHDHASHAHPLDGVPPNDPARGLIYDGLIAAKTGPCVGLYQIVNVSPAMCTHGPDAFSSALMQPVQLAAVGLPVCEGDGVSGRRVEVLYIHGSTSRYATVLEQLRVAAEGVDAIYNASAQETGGTRHVRFVTEQVNGVCRPVVRDVQISDTALNANDWAPLLNAVRAAGYTRTDRLYLEFVDANVFCGIGGFRGDTTKSDSNRSNSGPEYARADNRCWSPGVAAHELGHTIGAVNNNAPNGSGLAHCTDEWDVMCYKDGPNTVIRTVCADQAHDNRLDCNHDDYYNTNPAPGSYLANFWNTADSLFLIKGSGSSPSPTATSSPPPGTTFRLRNQASSSCMDDPNSNTTNGTQLIIWTCGTGANQVVTRNAAALSILGKCLDAFGQGTANGTRVILWTCNGQTNQQWTIQSDGTIRGTQSGRCIAPLNGATANNTGLVLIDCGGEAYKRWAIA